MTRAALAAAAALAALAAPTAKADHEPAPWEGGTAVTTPAEARFAAAASAVAGKDVTVNCHDDAAWATLTSSWGVSAFIRGAAFVGRGLAELSPVTCGGLASFIHPRPMCSRRASALVYRADADQWLVRRDRLVEVHCAPLTRELDGLLVLAHEAMHLAGVADEAAADCYAVQRFARAVTALGRTEAEARELAIDTAAGYARFLSADCRPDGPLDLSPGDGRWP